MCYVVRAPASRLRLQGFCSLFLCVSAAAWGPLASQSPPPPPYSTLSPFKSYLARHTRHTRVGSAASKGPPKKGFLFA